MKMRFALDLAEPHERPVQHRTGPVLSGVGLRATRTPHLQPWRLPMQELADLVTVSFLDLAKVVTAHACGLQRTGLDELLFGPDRIEQSIDAPTYAVHDRQIRREVRVLSGSRSEDVEDLAVQERAVRGRLRDAERRLKGQRIAELTAAGVLPFPAATDDSRRLARAWLAATFRRRRRRWYAAWRQMQASLLRPPCTFVPSRKRSRAASTMGGSPRRSPTWCASCSSLTGRPSGGASSRTPHGRTPATTRCAIAGTY
ncbi:hypothetical protein ACGH52_00105 [Streptomyces sp. BBFR25]|uniref:hypothetical protein n=1 Tax=Streptomyces sp. BBFR25 TaxID=3372855 RepID=UPI0037DCB604